eukprot:TRINITY_DN64328_c0_g1_i1.p1 TRINITY_DN64328_c0_g1~~TRINITY_DN64328_c0_g1_i1.p1  ORF type:complete len:560 (-),score=110.38 TRINITY_DN64328_c0_g1_i1:154-1833(-)
MEPAGEADGDPVFLSATWSMSMGSKFPDEAMTAAVTIMEERQSLVKVRSILALVWKFALLSGLMHVFSMLEGNIFMPYLYSRVRCCEENAGEAALREHYDITKLRHIRDLEAEMSRLGIDVAVNNFTSGGRIAACAVPALPPASKLWSLSGRCPNKAYVQETAQQIIGLNTPMQKIMGLIVMPVGGTVADSVGRRPVLLAYALACLTATLLLALDAQMEGAWGDLPVYIAGILFCVMWEPKEAVLMGSIADLTGQHEEKKGVAFAIVMALNTVGAVTALLVTFLCLRMRLENYFVPWACFGCLALMIVLLVRFLAYETLPRDIRRPITLAMLNPFQAQLEAARMLAADPVLRVLGAVAFIWGVHFIGWITMAFSFLLMVDFSMEEAVLPGALATFCQIFMAMAMVKLLPTIGVWRAYITGNALFVACYLLWGPYTLLYGRKGPYIANLVQATAFAFYIPAYQTIISQRVAQERQSRCMSALSSLVALGAIVGTPLYSEYLFDGTAQGWRQALPTLVSAALASVCTILAVTAARIATQQPKARARYSAVREEDDSEDSEE